MRKRLTGLFAIMMAVIIFISALPLQALGAQARGASFTEDTGTDPAVTLTGTDQNGEEGTGENQTDPTEGDQEPKVDINVTGRSSTINIVGEVFVNMI